jgi:UDP-N-acetylmuramyl pentapeptide phosphotransferase/UDP-N-acetylglucosamine-1-phosphate transferase
MKRQGGGAGGSSSSRARRVTKQPQQHPMSRGRQLLLLAVLGLAAPAYFAGRITDPVLLRSVLLSACVACLAYAATRWLLPKVARKTQQRGICGKDLNKRGTPAGDVSVPESAGLAPACVFLAALVLTEALHYGFAAALTDHNGGGGGGGAGGGRGGAAAGAGAPGAGAPGAGAAGAAGAGAAARWLPGAAASSSPSSSPAASTTTTTTTLSDAWLVDYNAALATVGFMAFLGFVDDVLDVPWRVKLALPIFAALPLTAAYSGGTAIGVPKPLRGLLGMAFCSGAGGGGGGGLGGGYWAAGAGAAGAAAAAAAGGGGGGGGASATLQNPVAAALRLAQASPSLRALLPPPFASGPGGVCANGALGPSFLQLGWLYRAYIVALLVFSSNAINILAGVNGLEAGQTFVVACASLAFNLASLAAGGGGIGGNGGGNGGNSLAPSTIPNRDGHLFSLYVSAPLAATSLALLTFNWYPARVFVGDTYTLFAGAALASAGILGHYSETLLLFLLPQVFNFLYSVPQLAGIVPCPRHRLPVLDAKTGLLHPKRGAPDMNLVNLTLRLFGPCGENALCARVLALQGMSCLLTFGARWLLAGWYK